MQKKICPVQTSRKDYTAPPLPLPSASEWFQHLSGTWVWTKQWVSLWGGKKAITWDGQFLVYFFELDGQRLLICLDNLSFFGSYIILKPTFWHCLWLRISPHCSLRVLNYLPLPFLQLIHDSIYPDNFCFRLKIAPLSSQLIVLLTFGIIIRSPKLCKAFIYYVRFLTSSVLRSQHSGL